MKEQATKDGFEEQNMVSHENFLKDMGCADLSIGKRKGTVVRGHVRNSCSKRGLRSSSLSRFQPWCKSVTGLDLSCSMTCTPSYRLLPIKYMRQSSSLHPLRAAVLNDHWVCVPANQQNLYLGCNGRDAYEKKLQDCEEDCCHLDVLVESTRAAIRRMEDLVKKIDSDNAVLLVESSLTALDWRCCNGLTDEFGVDLGENVRRDPHTTLPRVIDSLKSKQEKLIVTREKLLKSMKEAFLNKGTKSEDIQRI